MKKIIVLIFFILLICQSFLQEKTIHIDRLFGKWKHLESGQKTLTIHGVKLIITSKDTSKYLEFYKGGKMGGNYFEGSKYNLKDSTTIIINSELNTKAKEYRFRMNAQSLVLNNAACDEGCYETFIKVKQ